MKKRTKKLLSGTGDIGFSRWASLLKQQTKVFCFFFSKKKCLLSFALLLSGCAQAPTCPVAGQARMQIVEMYFGRDIVARRPVSDAEWEDFAAREITPRFPDGFTVFDAHGQWLNPRSGTIVRETTFMVQAAVPTGSDIAARVEAVSAAYKARFRQVGVGVVSSEACARF